MAWGVIVWSGCRKLDERYPESESNVKRRFDVGLTKTRVDHITKMR